MAKRQLHSLLRVIGWHRVVLLFTLLRAWFVGSWSLRMHLGFGDTREFLGKLYPAATASVINARLKYFHREEFPLREKVGKGGRTTYDANSQWKLVLAFELLDMGLPPALAISAVSKSWSVACKAISEAFDHVDNPGKPPVLLILKGRMLGKTAFDGTAIVGGLEEFEAGIASKGPLRQRLVIDLRRLVRASRKMKPDIERPGSYEIIYKAPD